MDHAEQLLLFGAAAGKVQRTFIDVEDLGDGPYRWLVRLRVYTTMRKEPATITVWVEEGQRASEALDILTPVTHKMIWCREDTVRHHMRRALDTLIDNGWEVKAQRVLNAS